jgi:hypothetical protein
VDLVLGGWEAAGEGRGRLGGGTFFLLLWKERKGGEGLERKDWEGWKGGAGFGKVMRYCTLYSRYGALDFAGGERRLIRSVMKIRDGTGRCKPFHGR